MAYAVFSETFQSSDYQIQMESVATPGDTAMTVTDGSCTWTSPLIDGGLEASSLVVGPGDGDSSSCQPLPPYVITWSGSDPTSVQFTPWGGDGGFTAERTS
jgi:hypothetical protein